MLGGVKVKGGNILCLCCFLAACFLLFFINDSSAKVLRASVNVVNPLGPTARIIAVPEKRATNISAQRVLNRGSSLRFKIFSVGASRAVSSPVFNQAMFSDDEGKNTELVLAGLPYGYYDIVVKGYSHLTRVLENVYIGSHVNLDFTENGQNPLASGDINLTDGDDKINALDISVLMNYWHSGDSRADLNQDLLVDNIDLQNLLADFNQVGD